MHLEIMFVVRRKKKVVSILEKWDEVKSFKAREDVKVPLKFLEYSIEVHEDPVLKMRDKVLHQPYQCAIQLINSGESVKKRATVKFVKVKPFQYRDRTFTVKPTKKVSDFSEVNTDDYMRNLRTALNQTFKSMDIDVVADKTVTLADFI